MATCNESNLQVTALHGRSLVTVLPVFAKDNV
jgi:hypothetical protein